MNARHLILLLSGWFLSLGLAQPTFPRVVAVPGQPSTPFQDTGNSVAATLSADGRSVVYLSTSTLLVTNRDGGVFLDVFVRDLVAGATTLVSTAPDGTAARGNSIEVVFSASGRQVAFTSEAEDLVSGDINRVSDIFLRDLDAETIVAVSVSGSGAWGNGRSSAPSVSANARRIAFVSAATNLAVNDTNRLQDVFVRDLDTQTTLLISQVRNGTGSGRGISGSPVLSADGGRVAFFSTATNLTQGTTNVLGDVYVRDLAAARTYWAGTNVQALLTTVTNTTNRRVFCYGPALSTDGRFVAFLAASYAGPVLVLRHDLATGLTDLLSGYGVGNITASADGSTVAISADGRVVAFVARTNSTSKTQVMVWTQGQGFALPASLNALGATPSDGHSETPVLTPDGRFVAFVSDASILPDAQPGRWEIYVRDLSSGTTRSARSWMSGGLRTDALPQLSPDGQSVVFEATKLQEAVCGVFLSDLNQEGAPILLSARDPSVTSRSATGYGSVELNGITPDGTTVVFGSTADDLVEGDANRLQDVFLRLFPDGATELVSRTESGGTGNGWSGTAVLSADARFVAFVSYATNLISVGDSNRFSDVFLRDRQEGRTVLVSRNRTGSGPGNQASWAPSVSGDGRWVAFLSQAIDLTTNSLSIGKLYAFLWDRTTGQNLLLTPGQTTLAPLVGSDGRFVVYVNGALGTPQLIARNLASGQVRSLGPYASPVSPFVLSPNGRFVVGHPPGQITVWDLVADSQRSLALPSGDTALGFRGTPVVSDDGRWVAFVTKAVWPGTADTNLAGDVFMHDFAHANTFLVSSTASGGAGRAASDSPAMSADGRWLAYRTHAGDLGATEVTGDPAVLLFDRLNGTRTVLAPRPDQVRWGDERAGFPILSADGSVVLFQGQSIEEADGVRSQVNATFFCRIVTQPVLDTDQDGMDDAWERLHFSDLSRSGPADFDADGQSDLAEYQAGTIPTDPVSRFAARPLQFVGGGVTLTWDAVPGRAYHIEFKDDLNQPAWTDLAIPIRIEGGGAVAVDPVTAPSLQRYYRVRAMGP